MPHGLSMAADEVERDAVLLSERARRASERATEVAREQRALAQPECAAVEHRAHSAPQLHGILLGREGEQPRHAERALRAASIEAHQRDVDPIGRGAREHTRDHRGALVQALAQPIERMGTFRHGCGAG